MQTSPSKKSAQGVLLFRLNMRQMFAIGTLKVREIIPFEPLNAIPRSHPAVAGTVYTRGATIPVIDLAAAVGYRPVNEEERTSCAIIVTDCQRQIVGFLVRKIERIIDTNWRSIVNVPESAGRNNYASGIIVQDDELIQLLDIETLLSHLFPVESNQRRGSVTDVERELLLRHPILMVDDSAIARKQLSEALDYIDVPYDVCTDGKQALDKMHEAITEGVPYDILVSDIEMPGLDGYELAFEVRNEKALAHMYLILHTSLSSEISIDRAHQVGANEALEKFEAQELLDAMVRGAQQIERGRVRPGVESRIHED
ncbi:chemotaxis protein [Thalassolituus sp. LLYu03]|uniref:chemotaxis protein n=1 Tax=Thalassolituus sp. LLYu03 TaxID=3421656 RepID=UPI003D27DD8A